jgi:hypothetical protein
MVSIGLELSKVRDGMVRGDGWSRIWLERGVAEAELQRGRAGDEVELLGLVTSLAEICTEKCSYAA